MNIICDKYDREYQVTQCDPGGYERFNIEYHGNRAGYANCHFEGDVLHIDDLHIDEKAMRPRLFFVDLFFLAFSFPPERWRITNYQNRGLGTAMIDFLANYGRKKLAKCMEGEIKQYDFKNNPRLPEWYRRRGFVVVTGDIKTAAVARVSLVL